MSQFNNKKFENGTVLSFDLKIENLEKYYSTTSPENAYKVIKKYLLENGFKHLKDSDYLNNTLDDYETSNLITKFALENKWISFCIEKLNVSLNVERPDIVDDIKDLGDKNFKIKK